MVWFLTALGLILLSGLAAVPLRHRSALASAVAVGGLVAGSVVGIVPALLVLNHGESLSLRWAWAVPFGAFSLELDPLAAFFLVPIFLVSALAGVYGRGYLGTHRSATTTATAWFGYNLLTVSMALVVTAHNAVLFLAAWELMTLASWALVTLDDDASQW